MIDLDTPLIEFLKNNLVSLSLLLAFIKGLAVITPWAVDDKIANLLVGIFSKAKRLSAKNGNGEDVATVPPKE